MMASTTTTAIGITSFGLCRNCFSRVDIFTFVRSLDPPNLQALFRRGSVTRDSCLLRTLNSSIQLLTTATISRLRTSSVGLLLVAIWFGSLLSFRFTIFIREFMALSLDSFTAYKQGSCHCINKRNPPNLTFGSNELKSAGIVGFRESKRQKI